MSNLTSQDLGVEQFGSALCRLEPTQAGSWIKLIGENYPVLFLMEFYTLEGSDVLITNNHSLSIFYSNTHRSFSLGMNPRKDKRLISIYPGPGLYGH